MKIDVQGFEQEVLRGAQAMIDKAQGIEIEISLTPLYEDQNWLLVQVLEYMQQRGFELMSITPNFIDKKMGRVLQCDGIFFRI